MKLPTDIYSVDSVRRIDRAAIDGEGIDGQGISGYTLMTRAAQAAVELAQAEFPQAKRWQVVCGAGNNAGDGYVLARLAAQQGIGVSVMTLISPESLKGDAATAYMDFAAEGGVPSGYEDGLDTEAELLVDALLGSGLERDLEGDFAGVVSAMNQHEAPVLALDLPSGLHGDSGVVMGAAVRATTTITFVGLKAGLFLGNGIEYVGRLHYSDLAIPKSCFAGLQPTFRGIDDGFVRDELNPRPGNSHKGDFGHVLIVAGGPGMSGAAQLCGEAALRSGAGLVSLATHPSHSAIIAAARPELMCHGVDRAADLEILLSRATVVAIGPGLGQSDWSADLFNCVLASGKPLVVDADGLNMLASNVVKQDNWILTPHPGEAGRLLDISSTAIQDDRSASLDGLRERFGGTVVLKGAGTLISADDGPAWLCSGGNPGMASPGMGDVLTGVIAALRAQGLSRASAAVVGVKVHAAAGDAAAARGQRGMIASDLLEELRFCVNP